MSLTKQDLQAIRGIVKEEVDRRFVRIDKRFDEMGKRFDRLERTTNRMEMQMRAMVEREDEHTVRLDRLEWHTVAPA
jgi:FKBP-type peptidyl-prolyl cis-trans isomerase (trigger factor)